MRITTKLRIDLETGTVLEHCWYEYSGPVALCKHEEEKAQAAAQTQLAQQQAAFYKELQGVFGKQFAGQTQILNFLQDTLKPLIEHPTGYSATEEAALRTQASETTTGQFESAARNLQERSFILGGRELPSGALLAGLGGLEGMRATTEAGGQREISLQNEALKRQNYWNAVSALGGVAGMQNPLGYSQSATGAGGAAVAGGQSAYNQWQAYNATTWSTFLGDMAKKALGGVVGGAVGALSGGLFGGLGGGGGSSGAGWAPGSTEAG
jgi:hypothetical protein